MSVAAQLDSRDPASTIPLPLLQAALDHIASPAVVVSRESVVAANELGWAMLREDPERFWKNLHPVRQGGQASQLRRVTLEGCEEILVLSHRPEDEIAHRLALARMQWRLTPRQLEVLHLLAAGVPTRSIAERLACAQRTVEVHISAILQKASATSRAQLVSELWRLR